MLRFYLKTRIKCGKRVTIGGGGQKSPKIALRILRMTPNIQYYVFISMTLVFSANSEN